MENRVAEETVISQSHIIADMETEMGDLKAAREDALDYLALASHALQKNKFDVAVELMDRAQRALENTKK